MVLLAADLGGLFYDIDSKEQDVQEAISGHVANGKCHL